MKIQDYVELMVEQNQKRYRNQSAAEVLLKAHSFQIKDWHTVLSRGGYYSVQLGRATAEWSEMHQWLNDNIGNRHYTWTGSTFWFETEETATLAALKWA